MPNQKNNGQQRKRIGGSSVADASSPEPEYVNYTLKMVFNPEKLTDMIITKEDRNYYPIVTTEAYVPGQALVWATVTIKNSVYAFPKDFDFDYTFHSEQNEETGYGFELIKEKLYFKNLPGIPTLIGLAEEKSSGVPAIPFGQSSGNKEDVSQMMSHFENFGGFQLTGTGILKNVMGSGIAMMGASTKLVVYHVALIKGWPL